MRLARLLLRCAMVMVVPTTLRAQVDTVPRPGRLLRVETRAAELRGRIVEYQPDTVVLDTAQSNDTVLVRIPRTAVALAHLHTGASLRPSVATGAVGGAIVAFVVSQSTLESNEYGWGRSQGQRFLTATGVVVAGALLGGLVGAWFAPDRWVRVDIRPYPTGR